ncbi:MAG: arginine repressor [Firmicutes bacterium]|jgi:transcriptional regulator of arginine metabolism|nr:arginine repressor [Bacillota bacterium]
MRYARQQKILELITVHEIDTQERLAEKLREAGFNVTQATVSRDIKELQLVKHAGPSGRSCYTQSRTADAPVSERFRKILRETILSINSAENIIVIKTLSGCANAAAEAIDTSNFPDIIGTLAGDNTIFMVVSSKEAVEPLMEQFHEMTVK